MSRILVVDDDPAVRMMVVLTLQGEGHDVVAMADGVAGLEAVMHETFDLVVTNHCMPHMNGDELATHVHQLFPNLPILRVGSLPGDDAAKASPGVHHLAKPFSLSAFRQEVRTLLPH